MPHEPHTRVQYGVASPDALFHFRADEKIKKHSEGSAKLGRAFLPIVFTTLGGIGPAPAADLLHSIFRQSARSLGETPSEASARRNLFYCELAASIARGQAEAAHTKPVMNHTIPPPPT